MYSRTATQFDLMIKTIMVVLFVFGLFIFFVDVTKAAQWVNNPANCATQSPGGEVVCQTSETPDSRVCGVSGVQYYCFSSVAVFSAPGYTQNNNQDRSGLGGGYIMDCEANDSAPPSGPFCDNDTDFWCNSDDTCDSKYRTTQCSASKWAYEASSFSCTDCISTRLDCSGDDVCEVIKGATTSSTVPNANYGNTCDSVVCKSGYENCDADWSNGCEIQFNVSSCTTGGGEPGVWTACGVCTALPPKYFLTASNTDYYSDNPLLWGTQLGSGDLISFSNATSSNIFVVKNDASVFMSSTLATTTDKYFYNYNGDLYWGDEKLNTGGGITYTAGFGLNLVGNQFSVNTSTLGIHINDIVGSSTLVYSTSAIENFYFNTNTFNNLTFFNSTSTFNSSSIFNDLVFFNSTSTFVGYTIFEGEVVMSTTTISDLTVTGTSTLENLHVNNIAIFEGPSYFNNNVFVSGTISSTNLYVGGNSTTTGDLYVLGQSYFHNILPFETLTYNIGSSSLVWKEGWFEKLYSEEIDFLNGWVLATTTGGGLAFISSTQVALAILPSGQVGVGTTTIEANLKLKVDGNIGSSLYCDVNGNNCFDPNAFGWATPQARYMNTTTANYNGNFGNYAGANGKIGYEAANEICSSTVGAGYHICQANEILDIIRLFGTSTFAGKTNGWVANGPPGYVTVSTNDCEGYTTSSGFSYGAWWKFDDNGGGGNGKMISCNSSMPISCCK